MCQLSLKFSATNRIKFKILVNNFISSHYRSTIRESSAKYNSENDFSYLCSSRTYVPNNTVIKFQRKSPITVYAIVYGTLKNM